MCRGSRQFDLTLHSLSFWKCSLSLPQGRKRECTLTYLDCKLKVPALNGATLVHVWNHIFASSDSAHIKYMYAFAMHFKNSTTRKNLICIHTCRCIGIVIKKFVDISSACQKEFWLFLLLPRPYDHKMSANKVIFGRKSDSKNRFWFEILNPCDSETAIIGSTKKFLWKASFLPT